MITTRTSGWWCTCFDCCPAMAASNEGELSASAVEDDSESECLLDTLPNELLLKLMTFLPTIDLLTVRNVYHRFDEIIENSSHLASSSSWLWRNIDLQKCYDVSAHILRKLGKLVQGRGEVILSCNIANCYWLTSNHCRRLLNPRMHNLRHLDIRDTAVSIDILDQILKSATSLKSLSFKHQWKYRHFYLMARARETWSQLRELNVIITKSCIFTQIFRDCSSLEAFSIDTASQPQESFSCRCEGPVMSYLPVYQLKYLSVSKEAAVLHPRSCIYPRRGYDFLSKMPALCSVSSSHAKYMKFAEDWSRNPELPDILSLEVDSSCDNAFLESPRLCSAQHLSIQKQGFTRQQLCPVENYSRLRSLNISGCRKAFLHGGEKEKLDLSFLEILVQKKVPLKHLNISGIHLHHQDPGNHLSQLLGKFHGLESLSLPICGLADISQSQKQANSTSSLSDNPSSFKHQRIGTSTSRHNKCDSCAAGVSSLPDTIEEKHGNGCVYCLSNLSVVVSGAPEVKSFELIGVDWESIVAKQSIHRPSQKQCELKYIPCPPASFPSVSEDALLCISRWSNLRSLVLAGLPTVARGHSLVAIAQNCRQLSSLSLAHLGRSGQCQFLRGLCEALQYADQLEDLRLEHPNIDINLLFQALPRCPSIRRLCIISENGRVDSQDVFEMMHGCPKLIALCLICCSMTATSCNSLKQELMKCFGPDRPALRIAAGQYPVYPDHLRDCLKGMPDIHLEEFILFESKVAAKPPSWRELEAVYAAGDKDAR